MAEPPVPADGNPSTDDTSEITDTDDSTAVDQPQAKKRWADLFNETEAKVEKPVEEDNSKYTVFIPHILEIIEEQKRMAEQLTIDDYTTLPGKSGATHSISLCIARNFVLSLRLSRRDEGHVRTAKLRPNSRSGYQYYIF